MNLWADFEFGLAFALICFGAFCYLLGHARLFVKKASWEAIENAIYDAITSAPKGKTASWIAFKATQNLQSLESDGRIKIVCRKHRPSYYLKKARGEEP